MPKIKGPKDGKHVIASFESKSKSLFPDLGKTKNLVLLSIKNNEYCEGEYLFAIIQQAIQSYGFSTFLIADEVYWHNLKDKDFSNDKEIKLKEAANLLGEEYFRRNLECFIKPFNINIEDFKNSCADKTVQQIIELINKMAIDANLNFEIMNWQSWINSGKHSFNKFKTEIYKLYQTEELLKTAITASASNFAKRHSSNEESESNVLERSVAYLVEESPVITWIPAILGYNFITYPGDVLPCFQATREFFTKAKTNPDYKHLAILERSEHLVNWLHVNFKREYTEEQKLLQRSQAPNCVFFKPSSPPKALISDYMYGVTKAILDSEFDINTKTDLIASVTTKLINLNQGFINSNQSHTWSNMYISSTTSTTQEAKFF